VVVAELHAEVRARAGEGARQPEEAAPPLHGAHRRLRRHRHLVPEPAVPRRNEPRIEGGVVRHERSPAQQFRERGRHVREGRRPQHVRGTDAVDVLPPQVPPGVQEGFPGVLDLALGRDQHHPHLHDPVVTTGEQSRGLQINDGVTCHGTLPLRLRLPHIGCEIYPFGGRRRHSPGPTAGARQSGTAPPASCRIGCG